MLPLLTTAQMKAADQEAITTFGMPELLLMEHAAIALVGNLQARFGSLLPRTRGIVVAGGGNNGGDVLAAARLVMERGCENVFVVVVGETQSASMRKQLELLAHRGVAWGKELSSELLEACDWILDGIFGIGLSRAVEGEALERIEAINSVAGRKWILSADIPSGLCADTGNPRPIAVRASATVTFGFHKRGLVTGEAAVFVGELTLAAIQIPRNVSAPDWNCFLYTQADATRLPTRRKDSHKGNFGRVAVIAGPAEREGAAALSALGALKAGTGLVTVYAPADALPSLRARLVPEVMSGGWEEFSQEPSTSVCVVGPGLGLTAESWQTLQACLKHKGSLVIDADGITLLAEHAKEARVLLAARAGLPTVLTPHPKEAARLLGSSTDEIQKDRYVSVRALSDATGAAVILKGAGSLCAAPGAPIVAVRAGDSGLSKGGTGDVLTGIVASLLAQGLSLAQAVPLAVYVHGRASELLTQRNGHSRSSLAGEVATAVSDVLGMLECPPSN